MDDKVIYRDLSYKLVGLAIQVRKKLGFGFLEKVYENAMIVLLRENGVFAQQQVPIKVRFHGEVIGDYIAEILVENCVILELNALDKLLPIHDALVLNHLRATWITLAILLKDSLEHKRLVF
jgi:GxxExxY protein